MTERTQEEKRGATSSPLVDVFETDEGVTLQLELPGVAKEDIKVDLEKDTLRVETTAAAKEEAAGETLVKEFEKMNYSREFILSRDLDRGKVQASWADGVLTLKVPKAAEATPRKIEITAG